MIVINKARIFLPVLFPIISKTRPFTCYNNWEVLKKIHVWIQNTSRYRHRMTISQRYTYRIDFKFNRSVVSIRWGSRDFLKIDLENGEDKQDVGRTNSVEKMEWEMLNIVRDSSSVIECRATVQCGKRGGTKLVAQTSGTLSRITSTFISWMTDE